MFVVLMSILTFSIFSQTLSGNWKGTCEWKDEKEVSNVSINFKMESSNWVGYVTEKYNGYTMTYEILLEVSNKMVMLKKFRNIKGKRSDGSHILFPNNGNKDWTTWGDFESYTNENDFSVCICDDPSTLVLMEDDVLNILEGQCSDWKIFWNLAQYKEVEKPVALVIEELPRIEYLKSKVEPKIEKLDKPCLNDELEYTYIDSIILDKNSNIQIKLLDGDLKDGDAITLFRNNNLLFENVTLDNEILFPVTNTSDFTWCSVSQGKVGQNTGQFKIYSNNKLAKSFDVGLLTNERANFKIILR